MTMLYQMCYNEVHFKGNALYALFRENLIFCSTILPDAATK